MSFSRITEEKTAVARLNRTAAKMQLSRDEETLIMRDANAKAVANINWPDLNPSIDSYDIEIANGISVRYQERSGDEPTLEIMVSKEELKARTGVEKDESVTIAKTNGSDLLAAHVLGTDQSVHFSRHGPGERAFIASNNFSENWPSVHIIHGKKNIAYLANLGVNFPGSERFRSGRSATA